MKTSVCSRRPSPRSALASQTALVVAGLVLLAAQLCAQAPGTGVVRGAVSNAVTGSNLENAGVSVLETKREVYTERDGAFEIAGLAPGAYTLAVEYAGLDRKQVPVVVEAGRTSRLAVALSSDVYVMPELVVAGQREGNAAAIVEQRVAPNIRNVITADAFGDITKANVGNLLRRIPGVTGITDDEIDTSVIQVRGMDASLTSIDIDGTRAASAMNGSRKQNVNAIPVDLIEKVEVAKATTAEDDAIKLGSDLSLGAVQASENIVVRDCLLAGGCNGLQFGSETIGAFRNIRFTRCEFGFERNDDRPVLVVDQGTAVRLEACQLRAGTGCAQPVDRRNGADVRVAP